MALKTNKPAAATALAAALSMLATPVQARDHWGHGGHHRGHHDNIDGGDVVAGVLVLGAIAAIAGAASHDRAQRNAERYPAPDDDGVRYVPGNDRFEGGGMDRAVDMCVGAVEQRSAPVGSVDSATRDAGGWAVSGALENGAAYSCWIGNDGRVSDVRVGDEGAAYDAPADGQWSDEDYARARTARNDVPPLPSEDDGRYDTSNAPDFTQ